jgi:hypothetical protein
LPFLTSIQIGRTGRVRAAVFDLAGMKSSS